MEERRERPEWMGGSGDEGRGIGAETESSAKKQALACNRVGQRRAQGARGWVGQRLARCAPAAASSRGARPTGHHRSPPRYRGPARPPR
eukprot:scaffold15322_cov63-Isochrysis_galbana.AAC.2